MKAFFLNASLSLISILLSCLLLEGVLRLAWTPPYFESIQLYEKHAFYKHRPIPGISGQSATSEYQYLTHHTKQGLRGFQEFDTIKRGPRILFLGDSFTYGVGVGTSKTFVELVNQRLNNVEVANGGAAAYDTRSEIALLDAFGSAFRPDLVVLCFFWNDLEGNLHNDFPEYSSRDDCNRQDSLRNWAGDPMQIFAEQAPTIQATGKWRLQYLLDESIKGLRYSVFGIRKRSIQTQEEKLAALAKTEELLDVLRCKVSQIGATLAVVTIPDQQQVNPAVVTKNIAPLNFEVQEFMASYTNRHQLPHLDLEPLLFRDQQNFKGPLYYRYDRHLNEKGHSFVAGHLLNFVESHLSASVATTRDESNPLD